MQERKPDKMSDRMSESEKNLSEKNVRCNAKNAR